MGLLSKLKRFVYLREFVYGGMDGCITTFAVVAGATGANLTPGIIIVLGFANLVADGFSMSVGNYLSARSVTMKDNDTQVNEMRSPIRTSAATFLSFIIVGLVPLFAYVIDYIVVTEIFNPFIVSTVLTGISFCLIGLMRSYVTGSSILKSLTETLLLGSLAAILAYFIGDLLEAIV